MKTQTELNPIELLKEEFAARYGVSIDVQVWVHDTPQETAKQMVTDFNLTSHNKLGSGNICHRETYDSKLGFDLYVIEKGEE